jgi:alkyl hydroperoxide reductase subunit AhpC
MIGIGVRFPSFSLQANVSIETGKAFQTITDEDFEGKWKIYFFWPKDFTFVCPTEISAFARLDSEFRDRDALIIGISIDSEFAHLAWRQHAPELKELPFPLLADVKRDLSTALGILDPQEGVAQRATYIVDPYNVIRYVDVYDVMVGRNPVEVLRVLDALQTQALYPANWRRGEAVLTPSV